MTPRFKLGDRVVLTREGCNQPPRHLMAVWTIKAFAPEHRIRVFIDPRDQLIEGLGVLGEKVYPYDWLVLHRRR